MSYTSDDGVLWFGYGVASAGEETALVARAGKCDDKQWVPTARVTARPVTTTDQVCAALDVCDELHAKSHVMLQGRDASTNMVIASAEPALADQLIAELLALHEEIVDAIAHWAEAYSDLCVSLQPEDVTLTDNDMRRLLGPTEE